MRINEATGGSELQLLCCSANLGNAQPDADSLAAWIPADGQCRAILKHPQQYPIRAMEEADAEKGSFSRLFNTFEHYEEEDQFDIIAIGLQESTFEPPSGGDASAEVTNKSSTSLHGSDSKLNGDGDNSSIRISVPVVQPVARKVLSNVSGLTASRDHLKKNKLSFHNWADGTPVLHKLLEARLPSYRRIVSFQRGEMRLEVFVNDAVPVKVLHVAAQNTGKAGLANKGGIVAELLVNGSTRINVLTAHLEAHEGSSKYVMRCSSLGDILNGTRTNEFAPHDVSLTSHYGFAMGDLNFRTVLPNSEDMPEDEHRSKVRELVAEDDWQALNEADELHKALRLKDCLVGYQTLFCNFPPTFKVLREPGFSYIEKRSPSYTDRILWKTGHQLENGVRPLIYEPIEAFASSDHKPIRAAFAIDLNSRFGLRPQMSRRGSMINVLKMSRKRNQTDNRAPKKREKIQLFVSQISCTIGTKKRASLLGGLGSDTAPNPYLLLVSFPEEALQQQLGLWGQFKAKVLFQNTASKTKADGSKKKSAFGWPRSSRKMGTYEPDWEEEDVHCEVCTHRKDGSSIDLSGAIFRLALMDYNPTGEDTVIGSYQVNLVNMLRECQQKRQKSDRSTRPASRRRGSMLNLFRSSVDHRPRQQRPPSSGESQTDGNRPRQNAGPQRRRSILNVFKGGEEQTPNEPADAGADDDDDDPISSLSIDGPLLKNGREAGRIRCEVECWWMDESASAALVSTRGSLADPASRYSRAISSKNLRRGSSNRHPGRQSIRVEAY